MESVVNPVIFYLAVVLAAAGLSLALPWRRLNLAALGITLAGVAVGMVLVSAGIAAARVDGGGPFGTALPSVYFYIFGGLSLLAGVRMITHARPIYSALYFILTIVSSSGLYVILSAEFMAFALIIIYAGAILITYLFVIMLATQAPSGPEEDDLADYDAASREPAVAAAAGLVLVAAITTMLFAGVPGLGMSSEGQERMASAVEPELAGMPKKVESAARDAGLLSADESLRRVEVGPHDTRLAIDASAGTADVVRADSPAAAVQPADATVRTIDLVDALPDLRATNPEQVGYNLMREHPATIEIAGVILLMAMLGATILARKKIELSDEQARDFETRRLNVAEAVARRAAADPEGGAA